MVVGIAATVWVLKTNQAGFFETPQNRKYLMYMAAIEETTMITFDKKEVFVKLFKIGVEQLT